MKLTEYIEILGIGVLIAVLLRLFVVDAVMISSHSMEETLLPGDVVIVNKMGYVLDRFMGSTLRTNASTFVPFGGATERGDVIVFKFPAVGSTRSNPDGYFVKRCVGLPGDVVAVEGQRVFVNGSELSGPWLTHTSSRGSFGPIRVPRKGDFIEFARDEAEKWISVLKEEGHQVWVGDDGLPVLDGQRILRYRVQHDYVFVVGDNLSNSYDGREWGFLSKDNIVGEAILVPWSIAKSATAGESAHFAGIRWNRIGTIVR